MRRELTIGLVVCVGLVGATTWVMSSRPRAPVSAPAVGEAGQVDRTADGPAKNIGRSDEQPTCPSGVLASWGEQEIAGEELCPRLQQLIGLDAPPALARAQGRVLLDASLVAAGVRARLNAHGVKVSDADVRRAVDELDGEALPSESLQRAVRERLELDRLVELEGDLAIDGEDVRAEYEQHPQDYGGGASATVDVLILRKRASADAQSEPAAIVDARAALSKGAAAPDVARRYKLELRPEIVVKEDGLEAELSEAAQRTELGRWSAPVHTRIGWCLVRARSRSAPPPSAFESVASEARERAIARRRATERQRIRADLLADPRSKRRLASWPG